MRACVFAVCIVAAPAASNAANILYYTSSPTSLVARGETRWVTEADGFTFSGIRYFNFPNQGGVGNAARLSVESANEWWQLTIVGRLALFPFPGHYPHARRWPFQESHQPGLDFAANGRGNNRLTGEFTVYEAEFNETELTKFAVDFVQYDNEELHRWVRGSIRLDSDVPVIVPEPSAMLLMVTACMLVIAWNGFRVRT